MDWGTIIATIGSRLIGLNSGPTTTQGTGGSAAPSANASLVPPPPAPTPSGGSWLGDAAKILGDRYLGAYADRMTAGMQGEATLAYNEAAYPGTNPWEHLGSGAHGQELAQISVKQKELQQRERESKRNANVALAGARINAGTAMASALLADGGRLNAPAAADILRRTGAIDPSVDFDPRDMIRGRTEAQLGHLDASAMAAYASGEQSLTQAQLNRIEAELRPKIFALDQWMARNPNNNFLVAGIRGLQGFYGDAEAAGVDIVKGLLQKYQGQMSKVDRWLYDQTGLDVFNTGQWDRRRAGASSGQGNSNASGSSGSGRSTNPDDYLGQIGG